MVDHKKNRETERLALEHLANALTGFHQPTIDEKKQLLGLLGVSSRFAKTFDCIRMRVPAFDKIRNAKDFDLIEVKGTKKHLPDFPRGFFFGMTENEDMLLKVLEDKYFLCFVSLHPESAKHVLVGWTELRKLIKTKRIQYQVNLTND